MDDGVTGGRSGDDVGRKRDERCQSGDRVDERGERGLEFLLEYVENGCLERGEGCVERGLWRVRLQKWRVGLWRVVFGE